MWDQKLLPENAFSFWLDRYLYEKEKENNLHIQLSIHLFLVIKTILAVEKLFLVCFWFFLR